MLCWSSRHSQFVFLCVQLSYEHVLHFAKKGFIVEVKSSGLGPLLPTLYKYTGLSTQGADTGIVLIKHIHTVVVELIIEIQHEG